MRSFARVFSKSSKSFSDDLGYLDDAFSRTSITQIALISHHKRDPAASIFLTSATNAFCTSGSSFAFSHCGLGIS